MGIKRSAGARPAWGYRLVHLSRMENAAAWQAIGPGRLDEDFAGRRHLQRFEHLLRQAMGGPLGGAGKSRSDVRRSASNRLYASARTTRHGAGAPYGRCV